MSLLEALFRATPASRPGSLEERGRLDVAQGVQAACLRHWKELSDRQQTAVLVAVSVQLSLSATAWTDLVTRPAARVNGRKGAWAAAIGVVFGPIAYFTWGRRPST